MPIRPGRKPGGSTADQQKQKAAELSGRAAESVDRRYDATKEIHHHERARAGSAEEAREEEAREEKAPEKDRNDDEGAA
jgi:hypothetical protein